MLKTYIGTPLCMSPELVNHRNYDFKVEILGMRSLWAVHTQTDIRFRKRIFRLQTDHKRPIRTHSQRIQQRHPKSYLEGPFSTTFFSLRLSAKDSIHFPNYIYLIHDHWKLSWLDMTLLENHHSQNTFIVEYLTLKFGQQLVFLFNKSHQYQRALNFSGILGYSFRRYPLSYSPIILSWCIHVHCWLCCW